MNESARGLGAAVARLIGAGVLVSLPVVGAGQYAAAQTGTAPDPPAIDDLRLNPAPVQPATPADSANPAATPATAAGADGEQPADYSMTCVVARLRDQAAHGIIKPADLDADGGAPSAQAAHQDVLADAVPATQAEPAPPLVDLTPAEAQTAYDCLYGAMSAAYGETGVPATRDWSDWATRFNARPFASRAHGARYVNIFANNTAASVYSRFDALQALPPGSILLMDSFAVEPAGRLAVGPLYMMEKMKSGFDGKSGDWRYYRFDPDGTLAGLTRGKNADAVAPCQSCHSAAADTDFMRLPPQQVRQAPASE